MIYTQTAYMVFRKLNKFEKYTINYNPISEDYFSDLWTDTDTKTAIINEFLDFNIIYGIVRCPRKK